jgi:adenylate kinase
MRLTFLGAPGVGKGTQAALLSQEWGVPQIATGNILRTAVTLQTAVGLEAKSYIDAGKLVPDEVIVRIVRERLKKPDAERGYILDGFPRTIQQAEALTEMLSEGAGKLDRVVYFDLNDEVLADRIVGRRSCPVCQQVYHVLYNPPPNGACACGASLVQRKDDLPETVKARLEVYRCETAPLIQYYKGQMILTQIDADQVISEVTRQVREAARLPGPVR